MNEKGKSPVVGHRYDFVYLFDVRDGNPNGDPDMANAPRFDPETFQGLVSDVCLKRKIRDYVHALKSIEPGYDVYVLQGHSLESRQRRPFENLEDLKGKAAGSKTEPSAARTARDWMCRNFFDVRTFGAVMSTTDFNCGQVRGPVQLTFARSLDRIFSTEHGITRQAHTTEKDQQEKGGATGAGTMGNKHTVAYGVYRTHGFVNPHFAAATGFSEADLEVLWQALTNMFDLDRSAARGEMACRGLWAFRHPTALGVAPAHRLFERIKVHRKAGVEAPRAFSDYEVTVDDRELPEGVELVRVC
jgi:CRISPR-associated protein Csd2